MKFIPKYWIAFFLLCFFCLSAEQAKEGKLIALMGLPGSGKSSVCHKLGLVSNIEVFCEDEENRWQAAVTKRELSGSFTMLMYFRSMRVPKLYEAYQRKKMGKTVFVDCYYDKLLDLYIDNLEMCWLVNRDDPYFSILKQIAKEDYRQLPNVDVLIYFDLDYSTWKNFLHERGRVFDKQTCLETRYAMNEIFLCAAKEYAKEHNASLIIFNQTYSSTLEAAEKLHSILKKEGIIDDDS